jgi:hypothetical protein
MACRVFARKKANRAKLRGLPVIVRELPIFW